MRGYGTFKNDKAKTASRRSSELTGTKESSVNHTVLIIKHTWEFISVINQLGAQFFCFTVSLFHASTCFEHMCSSSGGQNCITQPLVSSQL